MVCGKKKTPVRAALVAKSCLLDKVRDGITAIKKEHRKLFSDEVRSLFQDSIDLGMALLKGHERENRWDYLLRYSENRKIIAVEPHSASQHEVKVIIAKRNFAKKQLFSHFKSNMRIAAWLWVASGRNHFTDTERMRRILDQNGVRFVLPLIFKKHLL